MELRHVHGQPVHDKDYVGVRQEVVEADRQFKNYRGRATEIRQADTGRIDYVDIFVVNSALGVVSNTFTLRLGRNGVESRNRTGDRCQSAGKLLVIERAVVVIHSAHEVDEFGLDRSRSTNRHQEFQALGVTARVHDLSNSLIESIRQKGLEKNIAFYNKFLETDELLELLEASDIYLSLSQNPDQAVSGTLSYALGAGRPVVSTAFAHAEEIVTPEVGALVGFGESATLTAALLELMKDREKLKMMGEAAYFRTRKMTWPNVALSYMKAFTEAAPGFSGKESNVPPLKLTHLSRLTDDFGIFQFANRSKPDPVHGYTTDDNARALIAAAKFYDRNRRPSVAKLIGTYIGFLEYVSQAPAGFYNYVNFDKTFHTERNERENLSEANARAYYSLAFAASRSYLPRELFDRAADLFRKKFDGERKIVSPRAVAFTILALAEWLTIEKSGWHLAKQKELADYLLELFENSKGEGWNWFEDILAYSNGILPDALFVAYAQTGDPRYLTVAEQSLAFLIDNSFENGVCAPVGQRGWFRRGGVKEIYDQQPEEVATLVAVLSRAHTATGEGRYADLARRAFDWFLGENRLGQMVYDESTGGSYDGVGELHTNLNQGAESTVMYLLARLAIAEKMKK